MKKFPLDRSFLILLFLTLSTGFFSCKNNNDEQEEQTSTTANTQNPGNNLFFDLSLAQWSLNEPIFSGELDPRDFAQKASDMGFTGIEYVSVFYHSFYKDSANPQESLQKVLDTLKSRSDRYKVENVLIMVDGEGNLAAKSEQERNQAVENHKKWVDAAQFLDAHSIRVNLFGSEDPEEWQNNAFLGLTRLGEYAAEKNINVLVENHGQLSSNAQLLAEVMERVDLENVGTLPDFGNFCIRREGGDPYEGECIEEYDKYRGVEELMEHAKAVSAKSYDFDENGQETTIDYGRMLQIIKDEGYTGFIGVEYEGERLSPEEGIMATKNLLIEQGKKFTNQ